MASFTLHECDWCGRIDVPSNTSTIGEFTFKFTHVVQQEERHFVCSTCSFHMRDAIELQVKASKFQRQKHDETIAWCVRRIQTNNTKCGTITEVTRRAKVTKDEEDF